MLAKHAALSKLQHSSRGVRPQVIQVRGQGVCTPSKVYCVRKPDHGLVLVILRYLQQLALITWANCFEVSLKGNDGDFQLYNMSVCMSIVQPRSHLHPVQEVAALGVVLRIRLLGLLVVPQPPLALVGRLCGAVLHMARAMSNYAVLLVQFAT